MRKPLVAGNWKMNHGRRETEAWIEGFVAEARPAEFEGVRLVIAPPATSLASAAERLTGTPILLAAQNCHWESSGAFTGELSPQMLVDGCCSMVILGHSERRQHFGETDDQIARKTAAAYAVGLVPILCVGEVERQREAGQTEDVIGGQLRNGLELLADVDPQRLVVAYEPVWAIGTGKVATPDQAQQAHAFLRSILGQVVGEAVASQVPILYGGSVKPDNAAELGDRPDIDGFLVGGASLSPTPFLQIARALLG